MLGVDPQGQTPLDLAKRSNAKDVVQTLEPIVRAKLIELEMRRSAEVVHSGSVTMANKIRGKRVSRGEASGASGSGTDEEGSKPGTKRKHADQEEAESVDSGDDSEEISKEAQLPRTKRRQLSKKMEESQKEGKEEQAPIKVESTSTTRSSKRTRAVNSGTASGVGGSHPDLTSPSNGKEEEIPTPIRGEPATPKVTSHRRPTSSANRIRVTPTPRSSTPKSSQ